MEADMPNITSDTASSINDITIKVDPQPKAPRGRKAKGEAPAAPRKAKGDPATVREALAQMETLLSGPRRSQDEQAAMLEAAGLTVEPAFNTYAAKGHGITATGTAGPLGALRNWCNAARRRLLAEEGNG
jgi:hypothetical protein